MKLIKERGISRAHTSRDLGVHFMSGSWHGGKSRIFEKAAIYREARSMRRLILESRRRGNTRSHHALNNWRA